MSFHPRHSITLTPQASALIPNYEIVREDIKIPRIDGLSECLKLSFLREPKYKMLRESIPLAEKRIVNIPCERINNWHNYIVHSKDSNYLESWRDDCKVPDNWVGPKLKKSC